MMPITVVPPALPHRRRWRHDPYAPGPGLHDVDAETAPADDRQLRVPSTRTLPVQPTPGEGSGAGAGGKNSAAKAGARLRPAVVRRHEPYSRPLPTTIDAAPDAPTTSSDGAFATTPSDEWLAAAGCVAVVSTPTAQVVSFPAQQHQLQAVAGLRSPIAPPLSMQSLHRSSSRTNVTTTGGGWPLPTPRHSPPHDGPFAAGPTSPTSLASSHNQPYTGTATTMTMPMEWPWPPLAGAPSLFLPPACARELDGPSGCYYQRHHYQQHQYASMPPPPSVAPTPPSHTWTDIYPTSAVDRNAPTLAGLAPLPPPAFDHHRRHEAVDDEDFCASVSTSSLTADGLSPIDECAAVAAAGGGAGTPPPPTPAALADFERLVIPIVHRAFASLQVGANQQLLGLWPDASAEETEGLARLLPHFSGSCETTTTTPMVVHSVSCPRLLVTVAACIGEQLSAEHAAMFRAHFMPHFHNFLEDRCGYRSFIPRDMMLAQRRVPAEFARLWPDFDPEAYDLAYGGCSRGIASEGEHGDVTQTDRRVAPEALFRRDDEVVARELDGPHLSHAATSAGHVGRAKRGVVKAERAAVAHRHAMGIVGTPIARADQMVLAPAARVFRALIRRRAAARYADEVTSRSNNGCPPPPPPCADDSDAPLPVTEPAPPRRLRVLTVKERWSVARQVQAELECAAVSRRGGPPPATPAASFFHVFGRRDALRWVQQALSGIHDMVRDVLRHLPRGEHSAQAVVVYVQSRVTAAQLGRGRSVATLREALQLGCTPSAAADRPFPWTANSRKGSWRDNAATAAAADEDRKASPRRVRRTAAAVTLMMNGML